MSSKDMSRITIIINIIIINSNNIIIILIIITIIIITRPKPASGLKGLAGVSLLASGAQLMRGKCSFFCDKQTLRHNIYVIIITLVVLQTDSMRASLAKIAFLISHLSSAVWASRFNSFASSFFWTITVEFEYHSPCVTCSL